MTYRLKLFFKILLTSIFILCIPVFLVTSNVRWVIDTPLLYSYGFDKYDTAARTGIERAELIKAGKLFRDYFNNDQNLLQVRVVQNGVLRNIYNAKEIAHMVDVKNLVQGVFNIQTYLGVFLAIFITLGFLIYRAKWLRILGELIALGGMLTLALVVFVGLLSLIGFDKLFLAFHIISFDNNLWQLDPRRDMLLIMFPQGFFFDATMWIVGATVFQAIILCLYKCWLWTKKLRLNI
tara:strand:+ start:991 stop:1698 length:708 start_codon:yes stop_codon:yes gene_type:complete